MWTLVLVRSGFAADATSGNRLGSSRDTAPVASGVKTRHIGQDSTQEMADALSDPLYTKCGQNCYHEKARENMSLQILYMQRKLDTLTKYAYEQRIYDLLSDADKGSKNEPSDKEARELLGNYCKKNPTEDLLDCIDRYSKIHTLWITQARGVLAQSESAIQKLKCTNLGADGSCLVPTVEDGTLRDNPDKTTQVPYFLKSNEFLRFYEEQKQRNGSEQSRPPGEFLMLKPQRMDFVKFKEVIDPREGKIRVPEERNGQPVIDEDAYNRALQFWKEQKDDLEATFGQALNKAAKLHDDLKAEFNGDVSQQLKGIHRRLYDEARAQYIQEINGFAKEVVYPKKNASQNKDSKTIGSKDQNRTSTFDPSKVTGNEAVEIKPPVNPKLPGQGSDRIERHAIIEADHFRFRPPPVPGAQDPIQNIKDNDPGYEYIEY